MAEERTCGTCHHCYFNDDGEDGRECREPRWNGWSCFFPDTKPEHNATRCPGYTPRPQGEEEAK